MAFDTYLQDRIDRILAEYHITYRTIRMMGGLCYMVDSKMCVGIVKGMLMARVGPDAYLDSLSQPYVRETAFSTRAMKGYVFVEPEGYDTDVQLYHWIMLCLAYNPIAKQRVKKQ